MSFWKWTQVFFFSCFTCQSHRLRLQLLWVHISLVFIIGQILSSKKAKTTKQDDFLWGTPIYWAGRNANNLLQWGKYCIRSTLFMEVQDRERVRPLNHSFMEQLLKAKSSSVAEANKPWKRSFFYSRNSACSYERQTHR